MRFIPFLFLLVSIKGFSQCKDFIISVKGDTLNCIDFNGKKQGPWVVRVDELRGEPGFEEEGFFRDDNKDGVWRRFSLIGDLIAVENYRWNYKDGKNLYYTNMGDPLREEYWRAVDPQNPYDTVPVYDVNDPTKITGTVVVKLEGKSLKHGTWVYYDPLSGTIAKTEKWWLDRPANEHGNGPKTEDELAPIDISGTNKTSDTSTTKKTSVKPKEVLEFEKKNAGKKKIKVRDGKTGG